MSDIFNISFEGKCKGEFEYMIKTYVIDTNVLIQAPYALECFEDNNLILPLVVLEELDGLKKQRAKRGKCKSSCSKIGRVQTKGRFITGSET